MILICLSGLLAFATACGEDSDRVEFLATTEIAADITRAVAGPEVEVATLLPPGASPHDYTASASDRAAIDEADLIIAWSPRLEAGSVGIGDHERFELAAGAGDPHVWMDPSSILAQLGALANEMAIADPAGGAGYRKRALAYGRTLRRLDRDVEQTLDVVPPERRKLVTSHEALGQFARRYGFEFVGSPFGTTPESEPSAQAVADLIDRVQREDVPVVFAEDTDNPDLMEQIADEANVDLVDDLLVESFGDRVESYEEMLRYDAERIAEALRP